MVSVIAVVLAACKPSGEAQSPNPSAKASASNPPVTAPPPSAAASAVPSTTASATAKTTTGGARAVSEETDDFLFEYSYPKEAGKIAALAALLDQRLEKSRADLVAEAAGARRETREDGFPYNKHSAQTKWKVVSDLPGWLSLSGDVASYSGGAHGNYGFDSLVWDKGAGSALDGIELFQSPAALTSALGPKLCKALAAARAKKRGTKAKLGGAVAEFDKCVPVKDATVLVGSRGKRKFDRITIQYGPYAAGPYAEGAYQLDFPVDRAVLGAVKPQYKDAFAARN